MLRKDLQGKLEGDKVSAEIIRAGFLAYDYLDNPHACLDGAAYSWDIADAVLGAQAMGWGTAREKMQAALSLFESQGIFGQRKTDLKYIIRIKFE